jgi:hypothetical protein
VVRGTSEESLSVPRRTEQLDCLHRDDDQREALIEFELAGVSDNRRDWKLAGALNQRSDQQRIVVQRGDLIAAPR